MNKLIIAVFDSEKKAYEGLTALKELHKNGDITLYASAVISKDANGKAIVKENTDQGAVGTGVGLLTGGLIGLIAGPVGFAVGATLGAFSGLAFDIDKDEVNTQFAIETADALSKGKTAVVCEIDESWIIPVDTRMEVLGGIIFRRLRYEVAEDQYKRESEAISSELHQLKEELKNSAEKEKAKINASIAALQRKAALAAENLQKKIENNKKELDARLNIMKTQMKDASEKRKAKIQKRMDVLTEEYNARAAKLKQAARLIGEAFEIKETKPAAAA